MGILALKTEMCGSRSTRKLSCPTCSKWIGMIDEQARPLSVIHSRVRCAASNDLLSEKNQAVTFPDNRVYGINHVRKNIARNGGKFLPNHQSETFDESEMRRIFFL